MRRDHLTALLCVVLGFTQACNRNEEKAQPKSDQATPVAETSPPTMLVKGTLPFEQEVLYDGVIDEAIEEFNKNHPGLKASPVIGKRDETELHAPAQLVVAIEYTFSKQESYLNKTRFEWGIYDLRRKLNQYIPRYTEIETNWVNRPTTLSPEAIRELERVKSDYPEIRGYFLRRRNKGKILTVEILYSNTSLLIKKPRAKIIQDDLDRLRCIIIGKPERKDTPKGTIFPAEVFELREDQLREKLRMPYDTDLKGGQPTNVDNETWAVVYALKGLNKEQAELLHSAIGAGRGKYKDRSQLSFALGMVDRVYRTYNGNVNQFKMDFGTDRTRAMLILYPFISRELVASNSEDFLMLGRILEEKTTADGFNYPYRPIYADRWYQCVTEQLAPTIDLLIDRPDIMRIVVPPK